jgi:hypothetical protein
LSLVRTPSWSEKEIRLGEKRAWIIDKTQKKKSGENLFEEKTQIANTFLFSRKPFYRVLSIIIFYLQPWAVGWRQAEAP